MVNMSNEKKKHCTQCSILFHQIHVNSVQKYEFKTKEIRHVHQYVERKEEKKILLSICVTQRKGNEGTCRTGLYCKESADIFRIIAAGLVPRAEPGDDIATARR